MFTVTDSNLRPFLHLCHRVSNDVINEQYIRYFDNDGFELSYLEQEYYRENNINLNSCLNHICDQKVWFQGGSEGLKVDHALILHRWEFQGEARCQLLNHVHKFRELNKYLMLKPKWGIDFALEYYSDSEAIEVVHFENDYPSYQLAQEAKLYFENKILSTDWLDFARSLIAKKDEWQHLKGMAQNDWKAKHWGLNKAEETLKSFANEF
jgi:hypothetical protein